MTIESSQPQAVYKKSQQPDLNQGGVGNNLPNRSNKPKKQLTIKTAVAVIAILAFIAVTLTGVFIAQRQQQISGPVAPNVPSSMPAASEGGEACYLEFSVPAPDGVAECVEKVATTAVSTTGNIIPAGTSLFRGDEYFYQVTVKSDQLTAGNVTFVDKLPAAVSFVEDSQNTTGLTYEADGHQVTKSLGQLQPNATETITFKVRLLENAAIGEFTNRAEVVTDNSSEVSSCATYHTVAPEGSAICEAKTAFAVLEDDTAGEQLDNLSAIYPGDRIIYRITVTANEQTADPVVLVDTLPEQVQFISAITEGLEHEDGIVRAAAGSFEDQLTQTFEFIVEVISTSSPGVITNHVAVLNGSQEDATSTCSHQLQIPNNQCNDTCSTDEQCPNAHICYENQCRLAENPSSEQCVPADNICNDICDPAGGSNECPQDHSCVVIEDAYRCRLTSNPSDAQCRPASTTTPTPTPTPVPTPTPTPAIGCNENCVTNADCSNPDHICYTTTDGNRCRLADYVESTTCTEPATTTTTATPAPQPELPQELPQSGWQDMSNWLKAGLVTIGIGAALLLLL